ncbi:MAG: succinylglutamate desuccinylase/aspartoacylase family protein [Paracoccaceae bacterium]|nr:succinylglutamate desuccinylase/aspartoacylase family protein [Paracoccaceae bacterium]
MNTRPARIKSNIDLSKSGYQYGELMLPWSNNSVPLGYHPTPFISIKNGSGKKILIIGGNHGDEFEGPCAIMRLAQNIKYKELKGQVILIPALSFEAIKNSSRVNPLDNKNMNRAFPGDPNGTPTEMMADFLERELIPSCDAVIDLHSGGKASFFEPCTLPTKSKNKKLFDANMELAERFGLSLVWVLGPNNDNRSLNSAAERAGVAMIAAELGGGGGANPKITALAETGLINILHYLKILKLDKSKPPNEKIKKVELRNPDATIYAPAKGLFDRLVKAGQTVKIGQTAGWFHYFMEPERPSLELKFKHNGFILAHTNRGIVEKGEMLTFVVQEYK